MRTIVIFFLFLCSSISQAQTVELPNSNYLQELYNGKMNVEKSYSELSTPLNYESEKYFSVIRLTGKVSTPEMSISPRGENSIVLLWDSKTGKMESYSELGDELNSVNITETQLLSNGKIFVFGYAYLSKTKDLTLGEQTFTFKKDTVPGYISAIFNPKTKLWETVHFYNVGDRYDDNYIDNAKHLFDSEGNIYFTGCITAPYLLINQDTIFKCNKNTHPFFIIKLDANYKKIWAKQSQSLTNTTSLYNLTFNLDKSDNLYITGGIGYISGSISLDGIIVKNDTISSTYDYSYTDLFLYKINSLGTVQYGKTYLFRGTEQLSEIAVANDGSLYMCGDYNNEFIAPSGTFTTSDGDLFYNTFIVKINPTNGSFSWGQSIAGNMYYQDRLRKLRIDGDDNVYIAARFKPMQISFMGQTFKKRTDNAYASQILFAKIAKDGTYKWGNVLGATTSYTDIIEHQIFRYWNIENNKMYLSIPRQSYGTNKIFEWGKSVISDTKVSSGFFGNTIVFTLDSGKVLYNYGKELAYLTAIDTIDYWAINFDFATYSICRLSNKTTTLSGTVLLNNQAISIKAYTYVQVYSLMDNEKGLVKGTGLVDSDGKYSISTIPHGKYFVQAIPYDSTILSSFYKNNSMAEWENADTVDLNNSQSDVNIIVKKLALPTGTGTIEGAITIQSALTPSAQYFIDVQIVLYSASNPTSVLAFVRPFEYSNNVYSYKFNTIPNGDYKVVVLYPFSNTVDTASITIDNTNQTASNVDFKIINDKIYQISTNTFASETPSNSELIFDYTTKTVHVNSSNNDALYIYSILGTILYVDYDCKNKTIDLQSLNNGMYIVKKGTNSVKIAIMD